MTFEPDPKRRWRSKTYDDSVLNNLDRRERAAVETDRDLDKPIEQLVCDVHEETHDLSRTDIQNVAGAQKRIASLMARVAKSNDRVAQQMLYLNIAIAAMTLLILIYTILMWQQNNKPNDQSTESRAFVTLTNAPLPSTNMALIPAGSFSMGDALDGLSDAPPHTVDVSAFYMDKYEVTKALWDEVTTWAVGNGYDINADSARGKAANHPAYYVTWHDVVKWCNARSEKERLTPCYTVGGATYRTGSSDGVDCNFSVNGYRLPTEAEWEKAARGGLIGKRFPWGDTITHSQANHNSSSSSYDVSPTRGYHPTYATGSIPYTSPVGSFGANGYGLYDMAGNVWEWCWDWYDGNYYSTSPSSNRGPTSGSGRVRRGSGWVLDAGGTRSAYRGHDYPSYSDLDLGFRSARSSVP